MTEQNDIKIYDEQKEEFLTLSNVRDLLDIVYLINALIKNDGNITHVAEELDIGRRTVYDLMERYGISCIDGKLTIQLTPLLHNTELHAEFVEKYLNQDSK